MASYETEIEAKPLDDWHEEIGNCLWWVFPVQEPPYVGTPHDSDWPEYHTHWTPIPLPKDPDVVRPGTG